MSPVAIRLLHVEDDHIQQLMLAHQLAEMKDYRFEITVATSEDEALEVIRAGGIELVILDYHLDQGNGVSCLRRLRQIDQTLPVIAVSGVATEEIAAELISAGADDYLAKVTLYSTILGQSVRNVLIRAKAFRSRFPSLLKRASIPPISI